MHKNPVVTALAKNIPISIRSKLNPELFSKVQALMTIQRLIYPLNSKYEFKKYHLKAL
jgi:hypothetical protein